MKVLVVGVTGLLGRHVAAELELGGNEVTGTSTAGGNGNLACDISNPDSVDLAIGETNPDLIVLAAGQPSVRESWSDPVFTFSVNTRGPFNVLESMRTHAPGSRLIFASSAAVYGSPAGDAELPFDESTVLEPRSPYGASKSAAETLCHQFVRQYRTGVTIARFFNLIGPGQSDDHAPSEFARTVALAEHAEDPVAVLKIGNPAAERDFLAASDAARAVKSLAETSIDGTFNVCSGTPVPLVEIAERTAELARVEVRIEAAPDRARPTDVDRLFGANGKLRNATGWNPKAALDQTLSDLLEDWRSRVGSSVD